jgi:hypothetical protein
VVVDLHGDRSDPLDERVRNRVASAFRAEHLLQPALELGVARAWVTALEVTLDLHALDAHELTVEVELDLAEDVLAVSL